MGERERNREKNEDYKNLNRHFFPFNLSFQIAQFLSYENV